MKNIKIFSKDRKEYILKVDEASFLEEATDISTSWSVKYELDDEEGLLGTGSFKIRCRSVDGVIPEKKILLALISFGSKQVKNAINDGKDLSSVGYNMSIQDCTSKILSFL